MVEKIASESLLQAPEFTKLETIRIIDIPIYAKSIPDITQHIIETQETLNRLVSATGAHGLVYTKQSNQFKEVLSSFYLNLPDGMPSVWIGKAKGAKLMERCYGPDFFIYLMKASGNSDFKHFLCMSTLDKFKLLSKKEEKVEKAVDKLVRKSAKKAKVLVALSKSNKLRKKKTT